MTLVQGIVLYGMLAIAFAASSFVLLDHYWLSKRRPKSGVAPQ
ncbi:MAG: hypothetical protein ACYCZ0_04890 [Minisyncoccota bacterium]